MDLKELIEKIAMPSQTHSSFEGGKILEVTLNMADPSSPFYFIHLHLKKYLPALVFSLLKQQLNKVLQAPVNLSLEVEEEQISPQLLQDYLNQYIEVEENNHPQLQFMKQQQLVVRNKKINIVFDSIL